jgi:hypothetical protein
MFLYPCEKEPPPEERKGCVGFSYHNEALNVRTRDLATKQSRVSIGVQNSSSRLAQSAANQLSKGRSACDRNLRLCPPIREIDSGGSANQLGAGTRLATEGISGDCSHIFNLYSLSPFSLHLRENVQNRQLCHTPEHRIFCGSGSCTLPSWLSFE